MKVEQFSTKTSIYSSIAVLITAVFSPCCFPLFGFAASALGFGSFELFGGWTMWIFQVMVLISISSMYFAYRNHWCLYPLLLAIPTGAIIFFAYHFITTDNWIYWMYTGMFGLFAATIWDYKRTKMNKSCSTCVSYNGHTVELASTITCPHCKHQTPEMMPTDSCMYFYECKNCKVVLKPLAGDCCVYCSFGTVKCPPIQVDESCC